MEVYIRRITLFISCLLILYCISASSQACEDDKEFFLIDTKAGFGLADRNGNVVLKPGYPEIGLFNRDCNCVWARNEKRLWGTVKLQGQWILQPKYFDLRIGKDHQYNVVSESGAKKYRFIDNFGNYFFDEFDKARPFSEGLAAVQVKDKWGYIDKQGKLVIPLMYGDEFPYDRVGDFSEGLALVRYNGRDIYIRPDNTVAFELKKGMVGLDIKNGRAILSENGRDGIIDITGKLILPPTHNEINEFSEELAAFRIALSWGYLDREGNVAIKPIYEKADDFQCGLALVKFKGKYGYIDKTGQWRIKPKYDEASSFWRGLASVELNGEEFFIDAIGRVVFKAPKR